MIWAALSTRTSTSARAAVIASAVIPAASSRLEARKYMAKLAPNAASIPRGWAGLWRITGFSMPSNTPKSMLPGIHPVADDGGLAERLGGLQPVQALDQHETRAVLPHLDRHLLAVLEHALGDLVHARLHERFAPLDRHVDLGDREILAFHHDGATIARLCALRRSHRRAIIGAFGATKGRGLCICRAKAFSSFCSLV